MSLSNDKSANGASSSGSFHGILRRSDDERRAAADRQFARDLRDVLDIRSRNDGES